MFHMIFKSLDPTNGYPKMSSTILSYKKNIHSCPVSGK